MIDSVTVVIDSVTVFPRLAVVVAVVVDEIYVKSIVLVYPWQYLAVVAVDVVFFDSHSSYATSADHHRRLLLLLL